MARHAINVGNTIEETVNVSGNNPVPVEETEPAENTVKWVDSIRTVEISITTSVEEADEAPT